MSIIETLHNLLRLSLLSLHASRLKALMAAVEAGLSGASLSITALGRAVSGPAFIKHKIKRMDRLAGNSHLGTTPGVIRRHAPVVVAIAAHARGSC